MKKKVEVILIKDVAKQGKKNQKIRVAAGFARNFLLPRNLAILNDKAGQNYILAKMSARDRMMKKIEVSKDVILSKLLKTALVFARKVSKKGTLYGSVHAIDVVAEIKKLTGVKLSEDMIDISTHIKKPGEYNYTIVFSPENKVELKLEVVAEK